MFFDFNKFTIRTKLVYRNFSNKDAYNIEDILTVFHYYFDTYEYLFHKAHPMIKAEQIESIIEKMPHVDNYDSNNPIIAISPEQYAEIIDRHFETKYRCCDYNINHFFSGQIRELRFNEVYI